MDSIINVLKERDDICFLLIGDGAGRASAEKALADYKNVIFTGLIPYELVPQYLNVCDVLLSPHQVPKDENFIGSPTKLYEYMACGKIIIASDLNVYKHILKNNFNSKLIKVNDDKKWSKAIQSSFEKNKKNELIKHNAFQTAKKYTWDKRVQKIIIFKNKSLNI